jgi:hypothetical protein
MRDNGLSCLNTASEAIVRAALAATGALRLVIAAKASPMARVVAK